MKLPIGGGYAIHAHHAFWATEDKIYWDDGDITNNDSEGTAFCASSVGMKEDEKSFVIDYSKWTDEQRAEAKAKFQRLYDENSAEEAKEQSKEDAMMVSIKSKVTAEEYEFIEQSVERASNY